MSVELIISEARNGNPVLSVKSFDAGECFNVSTRINAWLERYCQGWKGYRAPARKDISVEGEYYCPIPLSHNGRTVSVFAIIELLAAMEKADVELEYVANHIGYVLPVEEEIDDLVYPFAGVQLTAFTKAELRAAAEQVGVTIGSKWTKQQIVERLEDYYIPVAVAA